MTDPVDSRSISEHLRSLEVRVDKYVNDNRYALVIKTTNSDGE